MRSIRVELAAAALAAVLGLGAASASASPLAAASGAAPGTDALATLVQWWDDDRRGRRRDRWEDRRRDRWDDRRDRRRGWYGGPPVYRGPPVIARGYVGRGPIDRCWVDRYGRKVCR
jgi:hypothetical protein